MNIAMLLSGGVDSSVALALLTQQGHEVTAFYLKIWLEDELSFLGDCPWEEDLSYARAVCKQLDVPLTVVPFQKEYHDRVVSYTIDAVKQGLTPNPDMMCNREIKFGAFNDWLEKEGKKFDKIATGHYAQTNKKQKTNNKKQEQGIGNGDRKGSAIENKTKLAPSPSLWEGERGDGNVVQLMRAPDPVKDQTYFLAMMKSEQIAKALFPIGHLKKTEVRKLAEKFNLPTAKRKDSQGICFLGKISFTDFIKHHLGTKQGAFIEKETGKELGTHDGFFLYTIGQRRGVDLPGGPWYVCDKDPKKNIVYLTHGFAGEDWRRDTFAVTQVNWITQPTKKKLQVKLRHGPQFYNCEIIHEREGDSINVKLSEKDQGVTPGQYAVFYDAEVCLGGGVIE